MKIVRYYPRGWKGDGGITSSVRQLSEAQVRAGANVCIAVDEDRIAGDEGLISWEAVNHWGPSRFRFPLALETSLAGADLLVLHSGWILHNAYAAGVARRMGIPYLLEPRGAYNSNFFARRRLLRKAWWRLLEKRVVEHAAAIHVFFRSQEPYLRTIGFDGPVICVPNGVSVPDQARWDGGSGGYVLWIGRFDPVCKGLDLLLRAMRLLPEEERPSLRLHGPDWKGGKQVVVDLVADLRLNNSVIIGEAVYGDEKWKLISEAAAFVYPSRWEGFGNSTAEAVSAGVPTLVTPYPLGKWLASRGAAVMTEASPEAIGEGLREVMRPLAARVGEEGRRLLLRELSWDAVARQWLHQTENVIASQSSSEKWLRASAPAPVPTGANLSAAELR